MINHFRHTLLLLLAAVLFVLAQPSVLQAQNNNSVKERELVRAKSAYIDGLAAFENEDYQQALNLLTAAYVKLPDFPGVNFALADVYLQLNDLDNASYYGTQAVRLDPENKWYHLKVADIYRQSGKEDAVLDELNTALKYNPKDTDILFELAQSYTDRNELKKANAIYKELLQLEGPDINIHLQRLKNFSELGIQDSAVEELQEIRKLDPDNLSTLQVLSNYYLRMDRLDEAKEVLGNALEINRRDPKTLIMFSDIYMKEQKWDSVAIMLEDVVADTSLPSNGKMEIARYLFSKYNDDPQNTGLQKATGKVLQRFIDAEPENARAQALGADFFSTTNQNDLALQALKKTNQLMPTDGTAWRQRLQLLLVERRTKEAIEVGQQANQQIPQDPIILYFLGSAYLSEGDNTKAIEHLEEASTLPARRPLKASIYAGLGSAYARLENWKSAFDSYEQSLKYDPENPGVLNNYAYFLSLQKQQLNKAETMGLRAVKLDPKNASYLDTIGWVYYQKGDFKKAQEYIQSALDTGQASAEVMEHMGNVMDKLNNKTKASYWWRKALEKDSTRTYLKEKISR